MFTLSLVPVNQLWRTHSVNPSDILIELCAGGIDDVLLAHAAGIKRIELNSGMSCGGLTPSAGLMQQARRCYSGQIIAMVRPREGGFCYSEAEFQQMLEDADCLSRLGCDGLAVGFLNSDSTLDIARCREFRERFPRQKLVFHRAFDVVPDYRHVLEQLVELKYDRILTSGGQTTAIQGLQQLRDCQERAAGRIEILPGSGIRASNVREVVRHTQCRQIHTSARIQRQDSSIPDEGGNHFGGNPQNPPGSYGAACAEELTAAINALSDHQTTR